MSETIFLLVSHQITVVSDQSARCTLGDVEGMMRRDLLTGVTPDYCGKGSKCQLYTRGCRDDDEERCCQRQSSYWFCTRLLW